MEAVPIGYPTDESETKELGTKEFKEGSSGGGNARGTFGKRGTHDGPFTELEQKGKEGN